MQCADQRDTRPPATVCEGAGCDRAVGKRQYGSQCRAVLSAKSGGCLRGQYHGGVVNPLALMCVGAVQARYGRNVPKDDCA